MHLYYVVIHTLVTFDGTTERVEELKQQVQVCNHLTAAYTLVT